MLKLVTHDISGDQTLWIGLTRENLDRLPQDMPIAFGWNEIGSPERVTKVVVLGGETMADILDDLRAVGVPIPKDANDS